MSVQKPATLDEIWLWANEQASLAREIPWNTTLQALTFTKHSGRPETKVAVPERLHVSKTYPPDSSPPRRGGTGAAVVGAPPFTRAFERYLDGQHPRTVALIALDQMRARGKKSPQSLEYRIAFAVLNGSSLEQVKTILRISDGLFYASAKRGLSTLFDLTQLQLAASYTVDESQSPPHDEPKGTSAHIRASGRRSPARPGARS